MSHRPVTIKTAAEILGVSVETLRNWDKAGKLKARRNKNNRYRLYNISDLESFANANGLHRPKRQNFKLDK
jgi:excisionase family DNA binding protein